MRIRYIATIDGVYAPKAPSYWGLKAPKYSPHNQGQ